MDFLKLSGKKALVTGGGRGIGEQISHELAQYGASVMICDINDENGNRVVEAIKANGGKAVFCHCDVTKQADVDNAMKQMLDVYGTIDILVNDAGRGSDVKNFWEFTDEEWNFSIDLNMTSAFRFCRAAVPVMVKNKYGKIVNISSGAGVAGAIGNSQYAAAKAGLIGFTKSIAREIAAYGITANVIAVPTTFTPATKESNFDSEENLAEEIKQIPARRFACPQDIADMVMYLVSDASSYVTSQCIAPNGGKR